MAKGKTRNVVTLKSVDDINGYILVSQAVDYVNASGNYIDEKGELKQCLASTINYWLRSGSIDGVKLNNDLILVKRSSLHEYVRSLPTLVEKRKEADRKKEELDALDKERKAAIARLEEEYKAKKAALAPSETATV